MIRNVIERECARIGGKLAGQCPEGVFFALVAFEGGPKPGAFACVTNGDRDELIAVLGRFMARELVKASRKAAAA